MNMTDAQKEAVLSRGNVLVSAAAGAGKTSVLTERVCRIVLEGTPVGALLVLTFTKAAAAEMKGRIEKRLREYAAGENLPDEIEPPDGEKKRFLRAQAADMGSAYIMTFDAFCGRVLRRYGHLAGISPAYRIIDELESAEKKEHAKDTLLTACAEEDEGAWKTLLAAFNGEQSAWEAVEKVLRTMEALPEPEAWLDDAVAAYADPLCTERALAGLTRDAQAQLRAKAAVLETARDGVDPSFDKVIGQLDEELETVGAALEKSGYVGYAQALAGITFRSLNWPRKTVTEEDKKPVTTARDALKDCIKTQKEKMFSHSLAEEAELTEKALPVAEALRAVALRFREVFAEEKRRANCADYPDMEHLTLKLLSMPDIAAEYREKFRFIFVDEYQDTNGVQERIVELLGDGNMFFVGDIKQSIYRFRQTDPTLFRDKAERYTGLDGAPGRTILLRENFRSSGEVIGAVNELFGAIMHRETGEIDYDEGAELVQGAPDTAAGGAELHLLDTGAGTEPVAPDGEDRMETPLDDAAEEEMEEITDAVAEARVIAGRIGEMMRSVRVPAKGRNGVPEERPLEYRDIAIILRSMKQANDYVTTFAQMGIPCYAQASGGFFDSIEVMLALDILRVIDNRRQDIPLLSVMRSSVGGFTASDLARIRMRNRERGASFFDALLQTAAEEDGAPAEEADGLAARARAFLDTVERWRVASRLMPLSQLLPRILTESGLYAEMGALVDGHRRQANLDALIDRISLFEQSRGTGIDAFIRFMESGIDKNARLSVAQQMEANVVRIMTVHGSKGLEFPVVFYARLNRQFNIKDEQSDILTHAKEGIGLRIVCEDGLRHTTALWRAAKMRCRKENLAEEMRVLYVAMTRAKQWLILSGTSKNTQKLMDNAPVAPDDQRILQAASPLDWVVMGPRRTVGEPVIHTCAGGTARQETYPEMPQASGEDAEAFAAYMRSVPQLMTEASVPLKIGVSAVLKREQVGVPDDGEEEGLLFRDPVFSDTEAGQVPLTAAERGTAVHTAAAELPAKRLTEEETEAFLDGLAKEGILSQRQRAAVAAGLLARLTETPLWERLGKSARVEKELPFSLPLRANEVMDTESEKTVLLQGVIDCCFLEDGAWVLVDYKTDRLRRGMTLAETALRHKRQMDWYQKALETLTGKPVKTRYIVLLSAGTAVEV